MIERWMVSMMLVGALTKIIFYKKDFLLPCKYLLNNKKPHK